MALNKDYFCAVLRDSFERKHVHELWMGNGATLLRTLLSAVPAHEFKGNLPSEWIIVCDSFSIRLSVLNAYGALYIYILPWVRVQFNDCASVCVSAGSHGAAFPAQRVLIYWLCQRIPSDQVQFSSTALISSPHQGCSPTFFFSSSLTPRILPLHALPLTATH